MIRIIVADDHIMFRESISKMLSMKKIVEVIASAENLRLYPNPATAEFIIAGVGKGSALKVFDLKR
ncbi:MAG TPA: hypothetical protein VHO72_01840 [Bacteroidales bacterium]|nr:hypothetical protein [Bacteroidales bacterium]